MEFEFSEDKIDIIFGRLLIYAEKILNLQYVKKHF